ncbi:hypothetical protein SAMN02745124_04256 [Desulfofustis glycolicus DSM 9705]|uniref:Uncharacterized protein n=1 Tax=Desulfofustis glycolicus DSM 9705 TaxID=1121409 RepID=A0A1M5YNR2_9BACT|nr:hypothetical protein SAMN02745124_04256 [Desulfofustis glycolicus DSM 9705]
MDKKMWRTPELIILARGRTEETVLTNNCKYVGHNSGPTVNSQGCGADKKNCGACQGRSGGVS